MNRKIKTKNQLKQILVKLKQQGKKIVFTNGCFELIHAGHIGYLNKAKKLGNILVVAVNTDSSIRKLKGKKRPIVSQKDRMEVLSALHCIDYVVSFNELTPKKIIKDLKPNILAKGADYKLNEIAGKDTVEKHGGKVVRIPLVKNKSTTGLIKRICRIYTG